MRCWFRGIKGFYQRGKRGYADSDIWDFDMYLCRIIPPALRILIDKSTGCPPDLYDEGAEGNECHRWEEALEMMAQGFEAARYIRDSDCVSTDKDYQDTMTRMYTGLELFKKYFFHLGD